MKGIPDTLGVMTTIGTFALSVFFILGLEIGHKLVYSVGGWGSFQEVMGRIVGIQMVVDGLTVFMLLIVNFIAFLVAIYSVNYMTRYTKKWQFYTLFLLMLEGMNGVLITGDMFNMFVFIEIASIASYALVAFGTEKRELEASFKYAVMGGIASLLILLAVVFLYSNTGTLNMSDMAAVIAGSPDQPILYLVFGLLLAGFGLKAAVVPFHAWLPDAHPSAPAPISAMLSGVLIKALGVYTIARVFFTIFGFPHQVSVILMTLGAMSMGVGALVALRQWDMKRLLAYSSISQVGYIMLGLGIGTPLGILGALFHLFNHSVFKSLLFLDSGAVEYATGTRNMKEMGGLQKKMPVTSGSALTGAMSLAGVPPFAGFWSKLVIIIAAVQAHHMKLAAWAVLMSILTIAYILKLTRFSFLGSFRDSLGKVKEVPAFMRISLIVLALVCILGGLLLVPELRDSFLTPAVKALTNTGGV
ncbi:MAG: NADH/ubiquinone/plastoquinone (complex I) [Candidatus Aegiribacteria sp.]|nr:NADH/ubiquinone/plastoquinone (complex I) [Candidatus Aegiribacteria sp.]MBD3294159.1 NADH/ubiquinone/plastoquinone (complex I) [Candidatus Fermentibacteria bacterium]